MREQQEDLLKIWQLGYKEKPIALTLQNITVEPGATFIGHSSDPVSSNLSLAKKAAIYAGAAITVNQAIVATVTTARLIGPKIPGCKIQ